MEQRIIHSMIIFIYYIIGAYATTDIVRLLKGCSTPINASECFCPVCHKKIALKDQLPIISYVLNHGACSNCGSAIPFSDIFLEIFLFSTMSVITLLLNFSWFSFFASILVYETTKLLCLFFWGRREHDFIRNLLSSIGNNVLLFALTSVLFLLSHVILPA